MVFHCNCSAFLKKVYYKEYRIILPLIVRHLKLLLNSVNHTIFSFRFFSQLLIFTVKFFTFFFDRRCSLLSFTGPQLYNSEALPFTYSQYVVLELTDKHYNSITVFLCFAKVCLSHRPQEKINGRLGALQHSLWLDVRSNHLAI